MSTEQLGGHGRFCFAEPLDMMANVCASTAGARHRRRRIKLKVPRDRWDREWCILDYTSRRDDSI